MRTSLRVYCINLFSGVGRDLKSSTIAPSCTFTEAFWSALKSLYLLVSKGSPGSRDMNRKTRLLFDYWRMPRISGIGGCGAYCLI